MRRFCRVVSNESKSITAIKELNIASLIRKYA